MIAIVRDCTVIGHLSNLWPNMELKLIRPSTTGPSKNTNQKYIVRTSDLLYTPKFYYPRVLRKTEAVNLSGM